jgi:iron complex outermembrane receptor protein
MQGWYMQDAIELTSRSQLTLGWRQDRVKYDATDVLDPTAPGSDFATEAPDESQTQREHAWEIGVRHAFGARTSIFARGQRSFRFVNAEEIYEDDETFSKQFQILRPQTAELFEVGVEWRAAGGGVRASLFRMDVEDEIHLDAFTTGTGNTNLPPSRRQGVEIESQLSVTSSFALTAGYAWTDAKFLEGVLPGGPFVIGTDIDIAGKRVPLVPEHKVNLGLVWDAFSAARISAHLAMLSEQYMDNDEPNSLGVQIPAYSVLDVKVARDFGWGRLAASVNNVLDERYYTYGVRSQFTIDRYAVYPLPGRGFSIMAELHVKELLVLSSALPTATARGGELCA